MKRLVLLMLAFGCSQAAPIGDEKVQGECHSSSTDTVPECATLRLCVTEMPAIEVTPVTS
jgi:hypothetical protein